MAREPRQPVGRRLWRRRRRRSEPGDVVAPLGPILPAVDDDGGGDDGDDGDEVDDGAHPGARGRFTLATDPRYRPQPAPPPPEPKRGLFARLFGKKPPPEPAYLHVDPVADILALPRGAARLDAFERRLNELAPGTPDHRLVALAFHKELVALVTDAGIDLSLFEGRVQACAAALIAAGEDEKAGGLFARIGRRHQAAELFARAGAIEALEETHAELAFAEGGARFDARLAFERFESLFLVGRRDEALQSLERAVQLWDNPIYVEVLAGFRSRLPAAHGVTLSAGGDTVRLTSRYPLVLGRSEDSAVRIDSPLVSRAHVDIQRRAGELVLNDLVSSGGTLLDGTPLRGPTPLSAAGTIDLAGVVVDYEVSAARLLIRPRLRPREVTLGMRSEVLDDPLLGFAVRIDGGRVRLVADGRARLNADNVRLDTLLLVGDRIVVSGRTWTVSA